MLSINIKHKVWEEKNMSGKGALNADMIDN